MKVLITGISGALGRMAAEKMLARGHSVVGIDKRGWPDAPLDVAMFRCDIRKRPAEEVFRNERPDALVHMATVTHLTARSEVRYRVNLGGTQKLFEYCHEYGVKQAVFIGRHTIYGAAPDAPLYRTEADPPLAMSTFPDLADLVAADLYAGSALWRWPELKTSVLRMVYTLGATHRSTLGSFLRNHRVPIVMGFDPLFQFMHELDAAEAICASLEAELRGVFNVAGPPPVPLRLLCRGTGRQAIPIPEPLYPYVLGRFGFPKLPRGAVAHIKHPIVVDDASFLGATGFHHTYDEVQVMESYRLLDTQ